MVSVSRAALAAACLAILSLAAAPQSVTRISGEGGRQMQSSLQPMWVSSDARHVLCRGLDSLFAGDSDRFYDVTWYGPSEPTLRKLDAIHARIDSPADRLLRSVEPWSSYVVLPIFALANAGVAWSPNVLQGQGRVMCAIMLGLVIGKSTGIVVAAWLAVRSGIAVKPDAYSWRQLVGAGALGGIGFTMSLFIAGLAFTEPADYAAAKIAIFIASLIAAVLGTAILYPRRHEASDLEPADEASSVGSTV